MQNLILNADQAIPHGGLIHIHIENAVIQAGDSVSFAPGAYVRCSVTDTGPGIDPDDIHRFFYPYFTTKDERTGLALASALSIIHNHQGWITADSTLGVGTTFSFYLRAARDQVVSMGGGRL